MLYSRVPPIDSRLSVVYIRATLDSWIRPCASSGSAWKVWRLVHLIKITVLDLHPRNINWSRCVWLMIIRLRLNWLRSSFAAPHFIQCSAFCYYEHCYVPTLIWAVAYFRCFNAIWTRAKRFYLLELRSIARICWVIIFTQKYMEFGSGTEK